LRIEAGEWQRSHDKETVTVVNAVKMMAESRGGDVVVEIRHCSGGVGS